MKKDIADVQGERELLEANPKQCVHIGDYSLTELVIAVAIANDLHKTTSVQDKSIDR